MQIRFTLIVVPFALTACHITTIAPADQVQLQTEEQPPLPQHPPRRVVKKQHVIEYRCHQSKRVTVQQPLNAPKSTTITLTFNQRSYKLSPNVVDRGQKYSNIRWIWQLDPDGKGTLTDNRHTVLAKNCKKR